MNQKLLSSIFWILLLSIIIFGVEIVTPQGVGEAILYVGVILVSLASRNRKIIYGTMILCTLLTIVGYFISPPGLEPWKSVFNRFFTITAFGALTFVGLQRIQVEENLFKSEERYRNVLDNLLEGAQIISFDWRYIYVNDKAAQQGRQTKENLIGRKMTEVYPDIEKTILFYVLDNCMKDRASYIMENKFTYPNGEISWFELSIQPVDEGLFILSNDISKRKRIESELYQLNMQLEERIAERTDSLASSLKLISSLYEVAQSVIKFEQLSEMLQHIVETVAKTLNADRATIIIFDHYAQQVNHLVKFGDGSNKVIESVSYEELMQGLSGWVLRELQPAISPKGIPDERESLIVQQRRLETDAGSMVVLPLLYLGESLGTMTVINSLSQPDFTNQEINWMQAIASQAAIAIGRVQVNEKLNIAYEKLGNVNEQVIEELKQRRQAEEKILQQNKMLSNLHQITLDLLERQEIESLLNKIAQASATFLDASYAEIMLMENDELVVRGVTDNQKNLIGERVNRNNAILSWQAFDTQTPAVLEDYSTWEHRRNVYNEFSLHAVADIPILNQGACIGILALGRNQPNYPFQKEEVQFGSLFANLAVLVIESTQLRETLREQSIRDPLTNLFNRRYMQEMLNREVSRADRQMHPLGIIMLDIDHFKRFNDTFGHVAGDNLLSHFGKQLQSQVRSEDIACRYGGEEFILIMPNTKLEIVKERAEQICSAVKNLVLENTHDITLSLGVAMYPQHGKTIEEVIQAADAALYQAKQNGRNQVVIADS